VALERVAPVTTHRGSWRLSALRKFKVSLVVGSKRSMAFGATRISSHASQLAFTAAAKIMM
jgi:CRISPR/Cas system endoribonuclease Cas6 (RAMP superfamily)